MDARSFRAGSQGRVEVVDYMRDGVRKKLRAINQGEECRSRCVMLERIMSI